MAKTKNTAAKADINFEQERWVSANEMSGAVSEKQYKDYIQSLLFTKHLSERCAKRKEDYKWGFQPIFLKSQLPGIQITGLINLFFNRGYDRN